MHILSMLICIVFCIFTAQAIYLIFFTFTMLRRKPPVLPTQHNCSWMMDILNFNTSDHWVWWSDHNMLVQIIVV